MNNIIDIFKTIWENPRYKALFILSLYLIFFTGIILFYKMSPSKEIKQKVENTLTPLQEFKEKYDYDFKVEVDDKILVGHYSMNLITFDYNGINYSYENNVLTPSEFEYSDIIEYLDTSYIYDLIKDRDIYSKTEYSNNTKSTTYIVDDVEISLYESKEIFEVDIKINNKLYKITY